MKFEDIVILISSLTLIGTIIWRLRAAWNADTYDVTGLNDEMDE